MAKELSIQYPTSGLSTVYFALRRESDGAWWYTTGASFETFNAAHVSGYAISATEVGTTGVYEADLPAVGSVLVNAVARLRQGGSPAWPADPVVGSGPVSVGGKTPATLAASDVTGNLPANMLQVAGQTANASGAVTFPSAIGTSTYAGADTAGTTTLLSRVTAAVALAGSAPSWYTAPTTPPTTGQIAAAILATPANLLATSAAGAVNLASTGLDAVVVETGLTAKQALQYVSAACFGVLSGAGTGTVVIKAGANSGTTRITAATDSSGNRTSVTLA